MPALPPTSDESVLNSFAEGILGKYTAEFTGAPSATHTVSVSTVMSAAAANKFCFVSAPDTSLPTTQAVTCVMTCAHSASAEGTSGGEDAELADALQRVREQLHSTQSSAAICLICLETMHNDDAVWHCSRGCCCVLHLLCIQAWSRQQCATSAYSAAQDSARCRYITFSSNFIITLRPIKCTYNTVTMSFVTLISAML